MPVAMSRVDLRERFLGCLLGCAVGDALGAPYEGLWSRSIPDEATLLTDYGEFEGYPKGQYTDDTQLSLATIESILAVLRRQARSSHTSPTRKRGKPVSLRSRVGACM